MNDSVERPRNPDQEAPPPDRRTPAPESIADPVPREQTRNAPAPEEETFEDNDGAGRSRDR